MNKVTIPVQFYGSKYAERLPIGKDDKENKLIK